LLSGFVLFAVETYNCVKSLACLLLFPKSFAGGPPAFSFSVYLLPFTVQLEFSALSSLFFFVCLFVCLFCFAAGTGTFGRVMLARDVPTQEYFALKIMAIAEVIRLRQVEHVNSEKTILCSISHPFIVNV